MYCVHTLARHFGWVSAFLSTPRYRENGILEYLSGLIDGIYTPSNTGTVIGNIGYEGNAQASLMLPRQVGTTYDVTVQGQRAVQGLHIPSHKPLLAYQPLQSIPTQPPNRQNIFNQYSNLYRQRYTNSYVQQTPALLMKEALVALGVFGFGNPVVHANAEARRLFEGFQDILRLIMPPKIGFKSIAVRTPEVILVTDSGEFVLDAVSGGVAALIDTAWQIFMFAPPNQPFVVTMDEPENHLHPEMQRTLLGSLINAFPSAQFIVSTHSPFVVTSVPDSAVYVLSFEPDHKVHSKLLAEVEKSGTANEILRDVLGLPATMPVWAQDQLEAIVKRYAPMELTSEMFRNLRKELAEIGLAKYIPETIAGVVERKGGE